MSKAEWQVMRVLWANPGATSSEVITHLSSVLNWQGVTVKTLLGRLRDKGLIIAEKVAGKYHYRALVSERDKLLQEISTLQSSVCTTKQVDLVRILLECGAFSKADLEDISQLALEKRELAPERVICQCIAGQCTCGQHGGGCHGSREV
ncbi:CopY/TcrY family copper transport repressor [Streptococcus ovuberis]|uniref:CopY/TcrY family copper transport repressor n=2 Tax=Streptococcus ovuberis TaxID=1936207 RepID=A0A7X6S0H0_9STRE|nr:CopY/TcrY family copper transport repressor [Streptococcus ovuberis]